MTEQTKKYFNKAPVLPLLSTEEFTAIAADAGIGLSDWASNDLASSLSFFNLAITRQAASCYHNMTYNQQT